MEQKTEISLENWKRKEYYDFFSNYDNPFFSIVSEIDCTSDFEMSKKESVKFSSIYLYKIIKAINQVDEFKYRNEGNRIVKFDKIHVAATVGRKDESFGFSFIEYSDNFIDFNKSYISILENIENTSGLNLDENSSRLDVIHFSVLPWINFKSVSHPRNFGTNDSIPKIAIGKINKKDNSYFIPIGLDVHHGFADGYHVGKFLDLLQQIFNDKNQAQL